MKKTILCWLLTVITFTGFAEQPEKINSLMLNQCRVSELARIITEMTSLSVVASKKASNIEVSVYLNDTPILTALQSICSSYGLLYKELDGGIFQIITTEEFSGNSNLFNYGHVEVIQVLYPPVEEMCEAVRNVYADRVIWLKPEDSNENKLEDLEGSFERMDQLGDRGQAESDTSSSSSSSSSSSGSSRRGSSSSSSSSSSSNSDSETVDPIDMEDYQSSTVSDSGQADHVRQSGVIFLSTMKASNTLVVRSMDQNVLREIKKIVKGLDKPTPQVLLEVKLISADVTDSKETGVNWLFDKGNFSGGLSTGGLDWNSPGSIVSKVGNYSDSTSAVFNYMTNSMNVRLRLLEENGKLTTIATPSLLVADNEASRIFTGSTSKFLESVEPGETTVTDGIAVTEDPEPTFEDEDIGTSLILTPKIHADRSVTIRILQDQSSFGEERSIYEYPLDDSGNSRGAVEVQDINRQSVVTTVVAKDNNVIVIGGLITENEVEREAGIPLLKDIPYLGWLFKDTVKAKQRNELIILIRPHVILAPGETQKRSQDMLDRISKSPMVKDMGKGVRDSLFSTEEVNKMKKKTETKVNNE